MGQGQIKKMRSVFNRTADAFNKKLWRSAVKRYKKMNWIEKTKFNDIFLARKKKIK